LVWYASDADADADAEAEALVRREPADMVEALAG